MPTNLLLLPLLGGFWFVHFCYLFRFRAQRLDGYRLLLESAFFGLLLSVPARLITYYWPSYFEAGRNARTIWEDLWCDAPLSGTATMSLLLGLLAPFAINWIYAMCIQLKKGEGPWRFYSDTKDPDTAIESFLRPAREKALGRAIESSGIYLHQLLHRAVVEEVPVLVTLQNRKVYVGYVTELPNLKPDNPYVWLLPGLSGYRDDKSLKVKLDLTYPDPKELPDGLGITDDDLLLTIPLAEVKSATLYHRQLASLILPYNG